MCLGAAMLLLPAGGAASIPPSCSGPERTADACAGAGGGRGAKVFDGGLAAGRGPARRLAWRVAPGEVVALEGPSGLRQDHAALDHGLHPDRPPRATVTVAGERVGCRRVPRRLRDVRRRSIGFVFQQFNLFPALTALENVEYALNVKGVRGARRAERGGRRARRAWGWPTACTSCRATSRAGRSSGWPSRGRWRARRACCSPTSRRRTSTRPPGQQILDLFRDLASRSRKGLVIVTHDPKVRAVADRVVGIRDGRLAA